MAGKAQHFVRARNTAPGEPLPPPAGKQSFDDLKSKPQKTPVVQNTHQLRSHDQSAEQSGRRPQNETHFYDTDGSNADKTSTTASAHRSNAGVSRSRSANAVQSAQFHEHQRSSSLAGSEEDGSETSLESNPEERVPERPIDCELDPRLWKKMHAYDAGLEQLPSGNPLPYMKGDSYPATTSGRPSDAGTDTHRKSLPLGQQQQIQVVAQAAMPSRGASQRQAPAPVAAQTHAQHQHHDRDDCPHQQPVEPILSARQAGANNAVAEINHDFQYSKPGKQQGSVRPDNRPTIALDATNSKQSVSSNTAHRASVPAMVESSHLPHQKVNTAAAITDIGTPQRPQATKERRKERDANLVQQHQQQQQQQVVVNAPQFESLSDAEDNVLVGAQATQQQPESPLDYEPAELFKMNYEDLRAQSFDVDPNAEALKPSADEQSGSLDDKLTAVAKLRAKDQSSFFSSIAIDEWEQAGDWFLGRFSEVVRQLKDARQEKRRAAQSFEDEIEGRYKAVGKKRKHLELSLLEMKESGGKVLGGTPKKTKTR